MLSKEKKKRNKDIVSNEGQMEAEISTFPATLEYLDPILFFQYKVLKAINPSSPAVSETDFVPLKKRNGDEADQSSGDYR